MYSDVRSSSVRTRLHRVLNQVSYSAQALAQGATEQASSVEELSATINEISNSSQSTCPWDPGCPGECGSGW